METTLRDIKALLDRTPGITGYALIGAVAMGAWIAPRVSMDVDVVAHTTARLRDTATLIGAALMARGWSVATYDREHPFVPLRVHAQAPTGIVVDVVVTDRPLHQQMIKRSEVMPVGKRLRFPVAGPEAIIVLKLIAGRTQDLVDVERLLTEAEVDGALLRRLARRAKVERQLKRMPRG